MKPAPPETAEAFQRVRQQLILAQVRIMELEDLRDELAPKLADAEKLLTAAQNLADQKIAEASHLTKTLAELQAQYEHLRHMQHVTNEALNESRREVAAAVDRTAAAEQRNRQHQEEIASLAGQLTRLASKLEGLNLELTESKATSAARLAQISGLDGEIRTLRATRSWRWTAWLRSIGRSLGLR